MVKHVFYLHGFASGATSMKARWLAAQLEPYGIELLCPDLNLPDFATLTVSRMIGDVERWMAPLDEGPVALIGSSLGALAAYHAAAQLNGPSSSVAQPVTEASNPVGRLPNHAAAIDRLILLAPALDIAPSLRRGLGGTRVDEWKRDGALAVYHYGYNDTRRVNYTLFEDCERYDPFTTPLSMPILIFQGTRDEAVDPEMVKRFANGRPNVDLHLLDDNHQLIASLPYIWEHSARFLGLAPR